MPTLILLFAMSADKEVVVNQQVMPRCLISRYITVIIQILLSLRCVLIALFEISEFTNMKLSARFFPFKIQYLN